MATRIVKNEGYSVDQSFANLNAFKASVTKGDCFEVMLERDGEIDWDTTRTLSNIGGDNFGLEDSSGGYFYDVSWQEAFDELIVNLREMW